MEAKENLRLKEVALSIQINHIDKTTNKEDYSNFIKILKCIAKTIGGEAPVLIDDIIRSSICDGFMGANDRELVAASMAFFGRTSTSKKLGITYNTFTNRYRNILESDYSSEEYLSTLEHIYKSKEARLLIDVLLLFLRDFKVHLGDEYHKLCEHKRTYEIEFAMIYEVLFSILENETFTTRFIQFICEDFDIDYSTINYFKNNIHVITRTYPKSRYNNRYFMQELYTLYTYKGFSKGKIGTDIFNKTANYLYCDRAKEFCKKLDGDLAWQYCETLYWAHVDTNQIKRFIKLLHKFIAYDV